MKFSPRLLFCLSYLTLPIFGHGLATAQQPLLISTNASPVAVGTPIIITVGGCGSQAANITLYADGGVIATNLLKPAGGFAKYTWTAPREGLYNLTATAQNFSCGPNPSPVFSQWVLEAPSYFGFYDSSSPGFPDETPTISSFANTTWIGCSSPTDCNTRLQEAQTYKMHAVVAFASPGLPVPGSSSTAVQTWLSLWKSNWQTYTSTFAPYVSNGTIAAFYPYDEPIGGEWSAGNKTSDTTSYLNSVATTIKQTFPSAKVAMVFTGANTFTYLVHGQNVIPSSYDWIGIDIYECWTVCQDANKTLSESYSWYVQNLEANLYSGQKVILLPATAVYTPGTYAQFEANPPLSDINTDAGIVQDILDLAGADNHVVGVFGFLYQTYYQNGSANPKVWVGCSDPKMTSMLNVMTEFGKNVEKR